MGRMFATDTHCNWPWSWRLYQSNIFGWTFFFNSKIGHKFNQIAMHPINFFECHFLKFHSVLLLFVVETVIGSKVVSYVLENYFLLQDLLTNQSMRCTWSTMVYIPWWTDIEPYTSCITLSFCWWVNVGFAWKTPARCLKVKECPIDWSI